MTLILTSASLALPGSLGTMPRSPVNDCYAPPPTPFEPPPLIDALRPHPDLRLLDLADGYWAAFVPSFSQVAVIDATARALLTQPAPDLAGAPVELIDGLLTLYRARLLITGEPHEAIPAAPETLAVWLHITNACNLRCTYCYVSKSNEAMEATTGRAAVDAAIRAARRYGYRRLAFKYAGGEPLLARAVLTTIHRYALERAAANGLELEAAVLSNGTLLGPAQLQPIRELGLRLMISLDGLAGAHDRQRPTRDGGGSAGLVLRGIERALEHGVTPEVAVTVTGHNAESLPELITWLLEHELPFSLSFYRDQLCASDRAQLQVEEQRLIAGMRAAYAAVERRPPRWSALNRLLDRTDATAPRRHACAAGESYLVIDHRGQVAKCQSELAVPVTTVHSPDPLGDLRSDRRSVQALAIEQKASCRSCEWRHWCAGGCPIATFRATGRFDVQSPHCHIYKALYPDLIRLEARRILFWAGSSVACL